MTILGAARGLSAHHLKQIQDDVDAELALIFGDDAEPSDTVLFDLLDCAPCHESPDYQHSFIGKCGETRCRHCKRIVG